MESIVVNVTCRSTIDMPILGKTEQRQIEFTIHKDNIWVALAENSGFSIDKDIAKVLLEKIADRDRVKEIEDVFLNALR